MCDHFLLSSFSSVSVGFFLSLLLAVHCEGRALDIYYPFGGVLQDIFSDLSFCSTLILLTLLTNTFFSPHSPILTPPFFSFYLQWLCDFVIVFVVDICAIVSKVFNSAHFAP